jgi:hypothetical protein
VLYLKFEQALMRRMRKATTTNRKKRDSCPWYEDKEEGEGSELKSDDDGKDYDN